MALKNLQDAFLFNVRKENIPVTIHLMNGFQIKGTVNRPDNFTAIIESTGQQQLVYKPAMSTITPLRTPQGEHAPKAAKPAEAPAQAPKE